MSEAGNRRPAYGTQIVYTAMKQNANKGPTFEIVYCSDKYFKTSSINETAFRCQLAR